MEREKFQYAKLPAFKYQTFERHYQTFDRRTQEFSYHPVAPPAEDPLTSGNDQENADALAKKPAEVENPANGSSGDSPAPPAEDSSSPGSGGEYIITLIMYLHVYGLGLIFRQSTNPQSSSIRHQMRTRQSSQLPKRNLTSLQTNP